MGSRRRNFKNIVVLMYSGRMVQVARLTMADVVYVTVHYEDSPVRVKSGRSSVIVTRDVGPFPPP